MKTNFGIFILLMIHHLISAQSLSPEVIASGGTVWSNDAIGSISWTLGEMSVKTYSTTDFLITEGFQQPSVTTTPVLVHPELGLTISIFPNPTTGSLYLEIADLKDPITIQVVNILGKSFSQHQLITTKSILDLHDLPAGIYFIQSHIQNKLIGTFKIQKI